MGFYDEESRRIVRMMRKKMGFVWMGRNDYFDLLDELGDYIYKIVESEFNEIGLAEGKR